MAVTLPPFKLRDMPPYIPYDWFKDEKGAEQADIGAYSRSDVDFRTRHAPIVQAEKAFQSNVLKDQTSDPLAPALQNEFMRSGLAGALGSLGDASTVGGEGGGSLTPGSSGEAALGRGLGMNIMDYQDRNRRNRDSSLSLAEQVFPRRKIGMSGQDYVLTSMLNNLGQNNFNQAQYSNELNADQLNYRISADNLNAQAAQGNSDSAASASQTGSLIQGGIGLIGALAMICWVARAAYGIENPKWRIFRRWLLLDAPKIVRDTYIRHGEKLGKWLHAHPFFKSVTRKAMDFILRPTFRRWQNV